MLDRWLKKNGLRFCGKNIRKNEGKSYGRFVFKHLDRFEGGLFPSKVEGVEQTGPRNRTHVPTRKFAGTHLQGYRASNKGCWNMVLVSALYSPPASGCVTRGGISRFYVCVCSYSRIWISICANANKRTSVTFSNRTSSLENTTSELTMSNNGERDCEGKKNVMYLSLIKKNR